MKTTFFKKTIQTAFILFMASSALFMISSCKKSKISKMIISAEGNYLGSGISSSGTPFVNQIIKVTQINYHKIKVEPVGHAYISSFEIVVERDDTDILSKEDENVDLEILTEASPYEIDFEAESNDESFSGTKQ